MFDKLEEVAVAEHTAVVRTPLIIASGRHLAMFGGLVGGSAVATGGER